MSGMRYIEIPKPETVLDQQVNRQTNQVTSSGTKSYSYFDMLREFVWARPEWRKDEATFSAWERCSDVHEEAEAKDLPVVAISEEDYAIFAPMAALRDVQLAGPNVKPIVRLTRAVIFASSKKPELAPAAPAPAVNGQTEDAKPAPELSA